MRTRRTLLRLLAALPALGLAGPAWATRMPSAGAGPFYPTPAMRFADSDNDLVRIAGQVHRAGGEIMVLKGRVLNAAGQPAAGARVEIWQCDAGGRYLHTADRRRGGYDEAFQGYGYVDTGADGAYAFRTIKPVPYPGRAPHIHVTVTHGGARLTTQFYLADHPLNARDFLYRRLRDADAAAVAMALTEGPDGLETTVDIRF